MTTSIFLDFAIRWRSRYSTVVIFDSRCLTFVDSALRFTNDCFLFVETTKPTLNAFGVFRTIWRSRPPRWWSRPGWETSVTSLWCLTSFWWPHQLDISSSRSEFYCCERIWFCFGSIRLSYFLPFLWDPKLGRLGWKRKLSVLFCLPSIWILSCTWFQQTGSSYPR